MPLLGSFYMTYKEKLKDPRWQKKRLEVFKHDNWTCQLCFTKTKTLHVHHKKYKKNLDPWDYNVRELITLCEDCHKLINKKNGQT